VIAAYLVANTADSADYGAVGSGIDFAPEIVSVDVHHVRDGISVNAPDLFDDCCVGHRMTGIPQQKFEESVFVGISSTARQASLEAGRAQLTAVSQWMGAFARPAEDSSFLLVH
jgi:hypothetical protein